MVLMIITSLGDTQVLHLKVRLFRVHAFRHFAESLESGCDKVTRVGSIWVGTDDIHRIVNKLDLLQKEKGLALSLALMLIL